MDIPQQEQPTGYQRLAQELKQLGLLYIENGRITLAEKMSVLLSTLAIALIAFALLTIACLFFTVALAHLLAECMPLVWAYAIMCGANLLVLVIILILRKPLIINPISRLLSRLILS